MLCSIIFEMKEASYPLYVWGVHAVIKSLIHYNAVGYIKLQSVISIHHIKGYFKGGYFRELALSNLPRGELSRVN